MCYTLLDGRDELLEIDIARLSWDDWNRAHIQRHGVAPQEVEEVLFNHPIFRRSYKNRLVVIGPTLVDPPRMLTVVIGEDPRRPGVYYPFSAHPASRRERRRYQAATEGGDRA